MATETVPATDAPDGQRTVTIFDTTLRDGEQSPGASMPIMEKLEVARALADLNVDVIEAGFPIASNDDFRSVQQIASEIRGPAIAALARCTPDDIDAARIAIQEAEHPRLHVFLGTSTIHREARNMTPERIIEMVCASVTHARNFCDDVEFSPEDAFRTEQDFLCRAVETAIKNGAATVNIPDTVGYATPDQIRETLLMLRNRVPNIDQATISVHCHDDLGLAVANSLAAVQAGAGQVECTINGIGERAGNCSLEELVMALKVRHDIYGVQTGIRTQLLGPVSDLVQKHTFNVGRNKAIVGRNAFAHEAGIHQDAFLKNRASYEVMHPNDVGRTAADLVLGKHSGINAVFAHLDKFGLPHHPAHRELFRIRFKEVADRNVQNRKNEVDDDQLLQEVYFPTVEAIIAQENGGPMVTAWKETAPQHGCRTVEITTRNGDTILGQAAEPKEGTINALVRGFNSILAGVEIPEGGFHIESAEAGSGADARATVTLGNHYRVTRTADDPDTDKAGTDAVVGAFNRLFAVHEYQRMIDALQ